MKPTNNDTPFFNILFVDDDPIQHFLVEHIINGLPFSVQFTSALSVEEAMTCLDGSRFDLIITDLNMPQAGGLELIQQLQEQGAVLPVIVLSSSVLDSDYVAIKQYEQVVAFWHKPLEASTIFNVLMNRHRLSA